MNTVETVEYSSGMEKQRIFPSLSNRDTVGRGTSETPSPDATTASIVSSVPNSMIFVGAMPWLPSQ